MIYYVDQGTRQSLGTREYPFKTVSEAAAAAVPGDEILVAPGVYREKVDPPRGGVSDTCRIAYRAVEPGTAVVTGAEPLEGWTQNPDGLWTAAVPVSVFPDGNPYTDVVDGDWFYFDPDWPVHRGQLFAQDRPLMEAADPAQLADPPAWLRTACPEGCWHARTVGNEMVFTVNLYGRDPRALAMEYTARKTVFHPSAKHVDYITLSGFVFCKAAAQWAPPTAYQEGMIGPHWAKGWIIEDCEIYGSRCVGITLGKYLQPENENKWTRQGFKHGTQTERDAVMQAVNDGWSRETVGSHTVRRCHIHDCGQAGIAGHMGCVFSLIEDNHIHHINLTQELRGAEIGGIKLHAAIDTVIRRNRIHHCTRGIWLDWQAQGTRVTANILHHNQPMPGLPMRSPLALGEDLFVEVSHGPTLIDHNLMLSPCAGKISTQGIAFAHNLVAGSFTCVGTGTHNAGLDYPESARYTPYHVPHSTLVAGFMTILHGDARFYSNIFVQQEEDPQLADYIAGSGRAGLNGLHLVCGTLPWNGYPAPQEYFARFTPERVRSDRPMYYGHLPVYAGGNVYFNGAQPCEADPDARCPQQEVVLALTEHGGKWHLETDLWQHLPQTGMPPVDSGLLGSAFESEQRFEAPDGSFLSLDTDLYGVRHAALPLCGPLAQAPAGMIPLDDCLQEEK